MNKFDIKDGLDRLVYRAYNALADVLFFFDFQARRLIKKNAAIKDSCESERCFILGTGPSLGNLLPEQIDKLKSEVLFGLNSYYKSDIALTLRPKYYALLDDRYWKEWSGVFSEVARRFSESAPVFVTDPRARKLVENISASQEAIYIYGKKYPINKMSDDLTKNIYVTMNVVSTCILVASYMGFKKIYLLGCDYNAFCSAGHGHCYDDREEIEEVSYNLAFFLRYYWITTEFHYLIAKLAKRNGVEVINLTPASLLDAYPRKPMTEIL